jgi:hypothetical protein
MLDEMGTMQGQVQCHWRVRRATTLTLGVDLSGIGCGFVR